MFKIKIEKEFNPSSDKCGQWFVKYDSESDSPVFTENENEAGIFIMDSSSKNDFMGNLMALADRFGYKGTPVPHYEKEYIKNEVLLMLCSKIKIFVDGLDGLETTPRIKFDEDGNKEGFAILCDNGNGQTMKRFTVTIEDHKTK
jgi:hypothetical protein